MSLQLNHIADCGEVVAGRSSGATAGGDSVFGDESVRASITDDTSGGGFTVTSITTYHVETVDPGELPPHHHGPPPTVLVTDSHVDGPGPLVVSSESPLIGVGVTFTAPTTPNSHVYTATVVLTGSSGHRQTIAATAEVRPVAILSYRVGTVSDSVISWGDSHTYDTGLLASVAFYGNIAVEVHVDQAAATTGIGSVLWYRVGLVSLDTKTISWDDSHQYGNGIVSSIALYGNTVTEMHLEDFGSSSGARLVWRVGTVRPDSAIIDWGDGPNYDQPGPPSVALNSNAAVALSGDAPIRYRVGISNSRTISLKDSYHYDDNGSYPSVALYADTVTPNTAVAVHNTSQPWLCWYRVGTVELDPGMISWGESHQYDNGLLPMVSLYGNTAVEVHHGSLDEAPNGDFVAALWYRVGVVSPASKTIVWGDSHQYDNGVVAYPSVALYRNTVVEVHTSWFGPKVSGSAGVMETLRNSRTEELSR